MSDSLLWRPGRLGPMELKNRVIRSATNEHLSEADGQLTTAWMDALVELAEHEVGLVITGHMSVDRQQRSDQGQTVLDEHTDLGLLYETARRVHAAGGHIVAQLNHGGKKAPEHVNGHPPKLPADFSVEELDRIVEQYRYAAILCRRAGFDGVQIHNAYGYLLASFLNHVDNRRTDGYGGSVENRFRLTGRIIREVRRTCGPDFAILTKVGPNNEELGEIFGVEIHTKEDAYLYGKKLKEMGAQNVLVSMGKTGAALIDEAGQVYFLKSPEGKRVNTVGSGDSMVAGFIAGFLKYNNYNEALKMGVSAGSASALSKYLATKEEVYNLFNNI